MKETKYLYPGPEAIREVTLKIAARDEADANSRYPELLVLPPDWEHAGVPGCPGEKWVMRRKRYFNRIRSWHAGIYSTGITYVGETPPPTLIRISPTGKLSGVFDPRETRNGKFRTDQTLQRLQSQPALLTLGGARHDIACKGFVRGYVPRAHVFCRRNSRAPAEGEASL